MQSDDVGSRIVFGQRRARLHRVGDEAIVDQIELDDFRGAGKRGVGRGLVADMPVVHGVIWRKLVNLSLARLGGRGRINHGRQHAIIYDELFRGIARLKIRIGDHHRYGVADVQGLAVGERGERPDFHRCSVL